MFSTNNYETGLKIQLKSKETHTHTLNIVRFMIKSEELVRLVAAPVEGQLAHTLTGILQKLVDTLQTYNICI